MKCKYFLRALIASAIFSLVIAVTVSAGNRGGYLKGLVKAPGGRPAVSVWVIVSQNGSERGRSLTGDDGAYYINNFSEGEYDVAVFQGQRLIYNSRTYLAGNSNYDIWLEKK